MGTGSEGEEDGNGSEMAEDALVGGISRGGEHRGTTTFQILSWFYVILLCCLWPTLRFSGVLRALKWDTRTRGVCGCGRVVAGGSFLAGIASTTSHFPGSNVARRRLGTWLPPMAFPRCYMAHRHLGLRHKLTDCEVEEGMGCGEWMGRGHHVRGGGVPLEIVDVGRSVERCSLVFFLVE